jgi:hypothetical protein
MMRGGIRRAKKDVAKRNLPEPAAGCLDGSQFTGAGDPDGDGFGPIGREGEACGVADRIEWAGYEVQDEEIMMEVAAAVLAGTDIGINAHA